MSVGLRHSTIETFRKRYHAGCVLKLYALNADGQTLSLLRTVSAGFYLTPVQDTGEGAQPFQLVVDTNRTTLLDGTKMIKVFMCDLVNETSGVTQRYKADTDTQPMIDEWRYVLNLKAAFGDKRAVI